ncbi:MAG: sigma-E factor negative regulatory protein [Gammaproteobacteria bacterium]|nr:sigma-E factor negative regulatory protein [Gammaproteobacteria bacterium]
MSDTIKQQISSMVDDELSSQEQELLMSRMQRDPALRQQWARYHMIGDVMRKQRVMHEDDSIASQVAQAISSEPSYQDKHKSAFLQSLLKPVLGLAVAASVAMVSIALVQNMMTQEKSYNAPAMARMDALPVPSPAYVQVSDRQSMDVIRLQQNTRLNQYLVNHSEYASSNRVRGMLPYVRVVSSDGKP